MRPGELGGGAGRGRGRAAASLPGQVARISQRAAAAPAPPVARCAGWGARRGAMAC